MKNNEILVVKNVRKSFGETIALDNIDINIKCGEIHGLIGENGSGKSTLSSIVAGIQPFDSGEMHFKGKRWNPKSMNDSLNKGIGMIVQETGTVMGITVAENIFIGEIDRFKNRLGLIDKAKLFKEAKDALLNIGVDSIDPRSITGILDFQDRKLIEIARIMEKNPDILIVDETTTALSQKGRDIIYRIIYQMRNEGKAVIFISHDLDEIMNVCNILTILRDGQFITTLSKEEFNEDLIKQYMIGRELQGDYYRSDYDGSYSDDVVLEIIDGTLGNHLNSMNLKLHKGEILGIGGLSHCGMHTVGKVLFGAEKLTKGQVKVHNQIVKNEIEAMKNKIGYVAKDRDIESLYLDASIKDNISIVGLDKIAVMKGIILSKNENKYVNKQISDLNIKCNSKDQLVSTLSGGNKQKVVFGKWIGRDSEILILDCPTRGIDIGVKQAMYQLMYQMKLEGKSIVIISEEMAELIGMADRLLIMKDGKINKEFMRNSNLAESEIIEFMI